MKDKLIKKMVHSRFVATLSNENNPKTILIKLLAPAMISGLAGFAISDIGHRSTELHPTRLGVFIMLLAFGAAALYLGTYIIKLIAHVEKHDWHRINISKLSTSEPSSKTSPYDDCISAVRAAKKSIIIIGSHFTEKVSITTDTHGEYLAKGIDHLISNVAAASLGDGQPKFLYKRIMQVDSLVDDIVTRQTLTADAIGDEALTTHVIKALSMREHGNIDPHIYAREFLPSFPSILIVDDEYVFFSLPYANAHKPSEFSYDFVLELRDKSGKTAVEFKNLFDRVCLGATEIKWVTNHSTPVRSQHSNVSEKNSIGAVAGLKNGV